MNEYELNDYDPDIYALDEIDIERTWAFGLIAIMSLVGLVTVLMS